VLDLVLLLLAGRARRFLLALALFRGAVQAQAGVHAQGGARMPLREAVEAGELALVLDVHVQQGGLADGRRRPPVERGAIVEVGALGLALAVQVVDARHQLDRRRRRPLGVRVEVDVRLLDVLADPARVVAARVEVGQEAAEGVRLAPAHGQRARPPSSEGRPVVARRQREPAVVEERALGVVVGVDRDAAAERRTLARRRARGILVDDAAVQVQAELSGAEGTRVPPQDVAAVVRGPVVLEPRLGAVGDQRRGEPAPRERERQEAGTALVAAAGHPGSPRACTRVLVHDLDDADERRRTVHDGRRAAQHLDAVEVVHVERGERGVEGAAPGHSVDDEQERVELLEAPELGNAGGRAVVAAGGDVDAGRECQSTPQVGRAAVLEFLPRDDLDRGGHLVGRLLDAGGGDLDVLAAGRGRRRGGGRLGPCRGGGRTKDQEHERAHAHRRPPVTKSGGSIVENDTAYYQQS
jgi:hypothetical protein